MTVRRPSSAADAVVSPIGRSHAPRHAAAAPVPDPAGAVVALLWNSAMRGDVVLDALREWLAANVPGLTFAGYREFGNVHGAHEERLLADLPGQLDRRQVDVVVSAMGAVGSGTSAMMRAVAAAELAGRPGVAIVTSEFVALSRRRARSLGFRDPRLVVYPGNPGAHGVDEVRARVADVVGPGVLRELARQPADPDPAREDETGPSVAGEGVAAAFERRGWTDGLPVVVPVRSAVDAFVRAAGRPAGEVLGIAPGEQQEATVEVVAANGVLAGCRPEYMPVLVATAQALLDPAFNLKDAGATPGWEVQLVVGGPGSADLGFRSGTGMMRLGARANSSVGRFGHLFLRNVGGLRPGELDMGSLGGGLNVVIADDDRAAREVGWPTYAQDRGFALDDDVVTAQSVVAVSGPVFCGGSAQRRLAALAAAIRRTVDGWAYTGLVYRRLHVLVVLSREIAECLAGAGLAKSDVRTRLIDALDITVDELEDYAEHLLGSRPVLAELAARGEIDPRYADASPGDRVPLLPGAGSIDLVIGGNPARNVAKVLVNAHCQGAPVTRRFRVGAITRNPGSVNR